MPTSQRVSLGEPEVINRCVSNAKSLKDCDRINRSQLFRCCLQLRKIRWHMRLGFQCMRDEEPKQLSSLNSRVDRRAFVMQPRRTAKAPPSGVNHTTERSAGRRYGGAQRPSRAAQTGTPADAEKLRMPRRSFVREVRLVPAHCLVMRDAPSPRATVWCLSPFPFALPRPAFNTAGCRLAHFISA